MTNAQALDPRMFEGLDEEFESVASQEEKDGFGKVTGVESEWSIWNGTGYEKVDYDTWARTPKLSRSRTYILTIESGDIDPNTQYPQTTVYISPVILTKKGQMANPNYRKITGPSFVKVLGPKADTKLADTFNALLGKYIHFARAAQLPRNDGKHLKDGEPRMTEFRLIEIYGADEQARQAAAAANTARWGKRDGSQTNGAQPAQIPAGWVEGGAELAKNYEPASFSKQVDEIARTLNTAGVSNETIAQQAENWEIPENALRVALKARGLEPTR